MNDTWKNCNTSCERPNPEYKFDKSFFEFYKDKKVLITGISGFKGSWMLEVLSLAGSNVLGYSFEPPTTPSLFNLIDGKNLCNFIEGDIRNLEKLEKVFDEFQPEIVIHMAAQPIVRESYKAPVYTYETNVMGTVNVCECVRNTSSVRSFLNVTTDKVYLNNEWPFGYREDEKLCGFDPYSNSKSCSELVTYSYLNSFMNDGSAPAVSTARSGNVIGGGDFAADRIIPDCVRAVENKEKIPVRNPYSTRPYQHVLEPIFAYLMICKEQYENKEKAGSFNVGPELTDCLMTGDIVDKFCLLWENDLKWENKAPEFCPHEANFLKLDCSKIKSTFGWKPRLNIDEALAFVVEWTKAYLNGGDVSKVMQNQINMYILK